MTLVLETRAERIDRAAAWEIDLVDLPIPTDEMQVRQIAGLFASWACPAHESEARYRWVVRNLQERARIEGWMFSSCAFLCHATLQACGIALPWVYVHGPTDEPSQPLSRLWARGEQVEAGDELLHGDIVVMSNPWHVAVVRGLQDRPLVLHSWDYGQAAPHRGQLRERPLTVERGQYRERRGARRIVRRLDLWELHQTAAAAGQIEPPYLPREVADAYRHH